MPESSLVSVVIPTYNRSWGLRRAVQSVLGQSYSAFELLIMDDASSDDTPAAAQSFTDSRIRYFRQPSNQGIAANWIDGARRATGRYLCFLMDDDFYWTDQFLADRVASLEGHSECQVSFGGYVRTDKQGSQQTIVEGGSSDQRVFDAEAMVWEVYLAHATFIGSMVYRRDAVIRFLPLIERYDLALDYALNLRLLSRDFRAVYCRPLSFARACHDEQVSNTRAQDAVLMALRVNRELPREGLSARAVRGVEQLTADWWLKLAILDGKANRLAATGHLLRSVWESLWTCRLWRQQAACFRDLVTP